MIMLVQMVWIVNYKNTLQNNDMYKVLEDRNFHLLFSYCDVLVRVYKFLCVTYFSFS